MLTYKLVGKGLLGRPRRILWGGDIRMNFKYEYIDVYEEFG